MNNLKAIISVSIGVLMFGCKGSESVEQVQVAQSEPATIEVSGQVKGGYRNIPLEVEGDTVSLTVYRGDYIKFYLDDADSAKAEYQLDIPDLNINSTLKDADADQPYFKMKLTGQYPFSIGERAGIITVVELTQANYTELSNADAWTLLSKNPPFLLDVRTNGEFRRGYIEGAALIPLQELQRRLGELEMYQNQAILIYCATGNRSTTASKILLDRGFKNVMNLRTGIVGWARQGYNIKQ